MPRTVTYHQCQLCGSANKTLEEARECEESHLLPTSTIEAAYYPREKYPKQLTIMLTDGQYYIYHCDFEYAEINCK